MRFTPGRASLDPITVLFLISSVILLGFIASILFRETGLPDTLFLILLGLLFGPMFHLLPQESLKELAEPIGAIAIALILFDGGLGLNLRTVLKESPKALILAIFWFILNTLAVAAVAVYWLKMPGELALYLGASLGGVSSAVVMGVAKRVSVDEETRTRLVIESVVSDVMCIVVAISVLDFILTREVETKAVITMIVTKSFTGLVIGALIGAFWLLMLKRLHLALKEVEYEYIATIGLALLAYIAAEFNDASGGIATLAFGLVMSNRWVLEPVLELSRYEFLYEKIMNFLSKFSGEVSFFIRSFFFSYIGMFYVFTDIQSVLIGLVVALVALATRAIAALPVTRDKKEFYMPVVAICGKGLAAAVLIQLPSVNGMEFGDVIFNVGVNAIIFSLLITTVATYYYERKHKKLVP